MEDKDIKRFWNKVEKTGTCWNWKAGLRGKTGYGCFKIKGKVIDVHRVSWIIHYGIISVGKLICHHCNNKKCVNPKHLYQGTFKDNYWDMRHNGNAYIPRSPYVTEEQKRLHHEEVKRKNLEGWHRRGKYLRDIRRGKIKSIPK